MPTQAEVDAAAKVLREQTDIPLDPGALAMIADRVLRAAEQARGQA